ncbi:MAG TPA: hypothetical protein PLZ15_14740 [Melioribacteraceae bacterium]|nr:hypothetical protein [Melioribacteraceae bacterium]
MSSKIIYKDISLPKLILSISEASRITNIDRSIIRTLIKSGEIDVFVCPGRIHKKIFAPSLIDFINRNSLTMNTLDEVLK